jgi:hypothetical protein
LQGSFLCTPGSTGHIVDGNNVTYLTHPCSLRGGGALPAVVKPVADDINGILLTQSEEGGCLPELIGTCTSKFLKKYQLFFGS